MNKNFNQLTPAETERLAILAEECAEVVQVIGKILRHGFESHHPDGGPTNRQLLERECGDVLYSINSCCVNNDVFDKAVYNWKDAKYVSVKKYLHHQGN